MRKVSVAVALISVALLLPAAPASANPTTCRGDKADAEARGKTFTNYLQRQHAAATAQYPQLAPPRFEGTLGGCRPGSAKTYRERGRKVRHAHTASYSFKVEQLDGYALYWNNERVVVATQTYTIRTTWNGKRFIREVFRPGGKLAVGGEDRGPALIPDIDPLAP